MKERRITRGWGIVFLLAALTTTAYAICGDGVLDIGELCDPVLHSCCAPNCLLVMPMGTVCRGSFGPCDLVEVCNGVNFTCPPNLFKPATAICRDVIPGSQCDVPERCTGTAPGCPPDLAAPNTTRCRTKGPGMECVADAYCPGTLPSLDPDAKVCPPISYLGNATVPVVCRDKPNQCDVPEFCPEPFSGMAGASTPWACPLDVNRGMIAAHPLNVNLTGVDMCDFDGLVCTAGVCNAITGDCVEPAATSINCECGSQFDCVTNPDEETSEANRFSYANEGLHPISFGVLNQAFFNYYGGVFNVTAMAYLGAEFFMTYNRHYQGFFDGNYLDLRNDMSPGFNLDYSRNMYDWPEGNGGLCTSNRCVKNYEPWSEDDWFGTYFFLSQGPYEGMGHCYVDGAHWFDSGQINFLLDNEAGAGAWPDGGFVAVASNATDPRVGLSLDTDIALFVGKPGDPCVGCVTDDTADLIFTWGNFTSGTTCLLQPEYQNLPCAKNPYFGKCQNGQCLPVPLVASVPTPCPSTTNGICFAGQINCDTTPNLVPFLMPEGPYCETSVGNNTIHACARTQGNCGYDSYCAAGNAFCPPPTVLPLGTSCRSPTGPCDAGEVCGGNSTVCPPDQVFPMGISPTGLDARGPCETVVSCDGENVTFSGNLTTSRVPKGTSFMCHAPTDLCDQPIFCPDPNLVTEWWLCPEPQLFNSSHICRNEEDSCLLPVYCTGNSTACPAGETLAPNGTLCGNPDGLCEMPSYCDGISPTCPPKPVYPAGTVCRPINGTCDFEEQCDGVSVDCPADVVAANTTVCHIPEGPCESAVYCPGPDANVTYPGQCPSRFFLPNTTECRSANGTCDAPENCDPSSGTPWLCPADLVRPNTFVCRNASDLCDRPETCDGLIKTCPTDTVQPNTYACRVPQGACEQTVYCNGISTNCAARQFFGTNVVCHLSEGPCDKQIACDPFSATPWLCPPTEFFNSNTICAIPGGSCATAGYCTGNSSSCPGVNYLGNSTICREAASQCDQEERCVNGSAICPSDLKLPLNTPCNADALNCTIDACNGIGGCVRQSEVCDCFFNHECPTNATCVIGTCLNGFCQQQLSAGFCFIDGNCVGAGATPVNNTCLSCQPLVNPYDWTPTVMGTPCSTGTPTSLCSAQDTCNGAGLCVDRYQSTNYTCRAAAHGCDEEEKCPGNSDYCPADLFKVAGTVCRNATDVCDAIEYCPAGGGPCPVDLALSSATLCLAKRGDCEEDAYCRGTIPSQDPMAKQCPTPLLLPNTAVCRPPDTICDKTEYCNPLAPTPWLCPPDLVQNSTVQCHIPSGPCDQPKFCTNVTKVCPTPSLYNSTQQCRVPSGSCEEPGYCTLGTDQCEPVAYKPQGTVCQPTGLSCAATAVCTGNSSACPSLTALPMGTECFAARGTCENSRFCDGISLACPPLSLKPAGTLCRQSADMERCDSSEFCSGNDFACGPDLKRPNGYPCPDSIFCNGDETCLSGVCQPSSGPRDCSDSSICTTDTCSESTAQCVYTPIAGVGQVCYDGPMGTADVGRCRSGTLRCNTTTGGLYCLGQVLPLPDEICGNGIDDDCNGVPDDACTGLTCLTSADCAPFIPYPCQNATCINNYCQYPVVPGSCLINGVCVLQGTPEPGKPCKTCQPGINPHAYTPNNSIDPSDGNVCNGVERCSAGNLILNPLPLQCPYSPNSCKPFECDPLLGCVQLTLPVGSPCTLPSGSFCLNGTTACNITNECECSGDLQMQSKFGDKPHELLLVPLIVGGSIFFVSFCVCVVYPADRRRRRKREQEQEKNK